MFSHEDIANMASDNRKYKDEAEEDWDRYVAIFKKLGEKRDISEKKFLSLDQEDRDEKLKYYEDYLLDIEEEEKKKKKDDKPKKKKESDKIEDIFSKIFKARDEEAKKDDNKSKKMDIEGIHNKAYKDFVNGTITPDEYDEIRIKYYAWLDKQKPEEKKKELSLKEEYESMKSKYEKFGKIFKAKYEEAKKKYEDSEKKEEPKKRSRVKNIVVKKDDDGQKYKGLSAREQRYKIYIKYMDLLNEDVKFSREVFIKKREETQQNILHKLREEYLEKMEGLKDNVEFFIEKVDKLKKKDFKEWNDEKVKNLKIDYGIFKSQLNQKNLTMPKFILEKFKDLEDSAYQKSIPPPKINIEVKKYAEPEKKYAEPEKKAVKSLNELGREGILKIGATHNEKAKKMFINDINDKNNDEIINALKPYIHMGKKDVVWKGDFLKLFENKF